MGFFSLMFVEYLLDHGIFPEFFFVFAKTSFWGGKVETP